MVEGDAGYVSRNKITRGFIYIDKKFKHHSISSGESLIKSH